MMLTPQDIQNMINLIDAMATRGALRGEELMAIGTFRQRLVDILSPPDEAGQDENTED